MKLNKTLFVLTGLLFIISACQKKQYSDTSPAGTYPFYFNGTINGSNVNLKAGLNNYYLFTSYATDGNNVYDFTGEFRDKNTGSGSPNSLKISIKDYRPAGLTNIDTSIVTGYYSFSTPGGTASKYSVVLNSFIQNGTGQTWNWDFGDGTFSIVNSPAQTHVYSHPGVYKVSLNAVTYATCTSSISNNVLVGQVGNAFLAQYSPSTVGYTTTFNAVPSGGQSPYTYLWDFGDSNTSTSQTAVHTYSAAGVYLTSLTMTDANGYTDVRYFPNTIQTTSVCSNYFYLYASTPVTNPMNLANVTIEWHDAGGNLWTSANDNQTTAKSMFKIYSVENYSNNMAGQPTKKIQATVSCRLYNGTSSMPFYGDVVFSIAHF